MPFFLIRITASTFNQQPRFFGALVFNSHRKRISALNIKDRALSGLFGQVARDLFDVLNLADYQYAVTILYHNYCIIHPLALKNMKIRSTASSKASFSESMVISACRGGSYGALTPVNLGITPALAFL
jgi:hypothetical protein